MKLLFNPLILAAAELALFASYGKANFEANDMLDLTSRDLGYDVVENYAVRDYVEDHYARQFDEFELSSIATRDLIAELENRLERRDDIAAMEMQLEALKADPKKNKKQIKKLERKIAKAKLKAAGSGTHRTPGAYPGGNDMSMAGPRPGEESPGLTGAGHGADSMGPGGM
ncbi:hypothetical protein CVT24_011186 [Panaeolus cyanescens]|uniref:Uncharacterized protein n=1 Tax=Panaeolus cyanescens TaxID=181874 RepID=A0A409YGC0_9AGAR|nr:hypothetical protein CVT24_011186 [Panaeolus cyanescens]